MSDQVQEHHVLLIEEKGELRSIRLEAVVYTMGRHASNAIVLNDASVSRAHAFLVRCPVPGTSNYCYKLLDGNSAGQPSTNGTFVNNQRRCRHTLIRGDVMRFGEAVKASYFRVHMTLEALAELFPFGTTLAGQMIDDNRLDFTQTMVFSEDFTELRASANIPLDGDITAVQEQPIKMPI